MKLLVIDGNSIMNRAFYGIRVLTNKENAAIQSVMAGVDEIGRAHV